ncbi:O-antigen ligase family protein [Nonlabens spongiae]|uniref:O-antigen ligase family protein n=1 Tax=Nonlabens spongiae TaxID=331648 RepID=UPI0012F52589|nr:O-antigen ligase family protein [Nonlabens spongiae]
MNFLLNKDRVVNLRFLLLGCSIFIFLAFSLLYTEDFEYGVKKVTTSLPLVVVPLSLSLWTPKLIAAFKVFINKFLFVYVLSVLLLSLITIYQFRDTLWSTDLFRQSLLKNNLFVGMEALYYSFHLALALMVLVHLFWSSLKFWRQLLLVVLMCALAPILISLSFKSAILSFLVAFGLYSLKINHYKVWTLFAAALTIIVGLISFSKDFNQRFADLFFVKDSSEIEYAEIKKTIQVCAIELAPEAGLFGYGVGDGKQKLIDCYKGKNQTLALNSYNSHNQYIGLYLKIGFLGLLVFAIYLFSLLYTGLTQKNHLGTSILIFIGIFMLAENIIEREQGVYYFALFLGFLFLNNFKIPKKYDMILSHEKVLRSFREE